jgi:hypothetical protein
VELEFGLSSTKACTKRSLSRKQFCTDEMTGYFPLGLEERWLPRAILKGAPDQPKQLKMDKFPRGEAGDPEAFSDTTIRIRQLLLLTHLCTS